LHFTIRQRLIYKPLVEGGKMKERFKDIRGMSLLEVMISLVILAVGLLGLVGLQVTAIEGNRFAGDMTEATNLALNRLEELRGLSFNPSTNPPVASCIDDTGIDNQLCMSSGWTDTSPADGVPDQGAFFRNAADGPFTTVNVGNWEYEIGWNIFDINSDDDAAGIIDTKTICVIVTWTDMLGVNRRVAYSTRITKSNPYNYDD
jgi:prepilin-type N-terminal cleavage/methylation domain-containing protein